MRLCGNELADRASDIDRREVERGVPAELRPQLLSPTSFRQARVADFGTCYPLWRR